jgi:hypothetical protein
MLPVNILIHIFYKTNTMRQACYATNNNLHEREHHDLSACQNINVQVSTPIKLFFMKKIKFLMVLAWILFMTSPSFAVSDLSVSGITSPSAANGIYVFQSVDSYGYNIWKLQSGSETYYIYEYYEEYFSKPWWQIDTDTNSDNGILFMDSQGGASSPTVVVIWDVISGAGSPAVAYYSVNPEINISGNGASIVTGDNTPSFSEHTKFGSALPNSGTATRTFTIQNTGAAALTVGAISFSGANPTEFTVTTSPTSPVAASGSATFTVTFTPTGTGDRTATVSIVNSDSDENPYTFSLNGYGYTVKALVVSGITSPAAANGNYISQGVLNNFQYWKHATENYYIFNYLASGVSPAWAIDNDQIGSNGTLFNYSSEATSPNGLTPWELQYGTGSPVVSEATPTPEINVVGNNSKNIASGDNSPYRADGTNFGSLDYSSGSRTRTYTIQNTGTAALTLSGSTPYISLSGATSDFSVTTAPSNSIAASGSTTFVVTFDPVSEGTKTAVVTITNNDSDEGTYTFTIQGDGFTPKNGVLSGVTSPSALNGTYTHQGLINEYQYWKYGSYYIYNSDNGGTEDANWYIDNDTDRSAYYFKSSNNGENGFPVNVTSWAASGGSGTPVIQYAEPEINITGNSVTINDGDATASIFDHTDFGWITSGSVVQTYTIQNLGTETLTLTGTSPYIVIGGTNSADFSVTTPPSATIAAGGSTTFQVTASPSALGTRSATLSIANTDTDENPYNFSIEVGLGILPVVTTQAVSNIGSTNAIGNGTITDLGVPNPTAYGICYGASANPDVTGSKVDKGTASATGAFTAQITGLTPGATYHVRAFATNNVGTSYGSDVTFTTTATITEPGNALNFDGTNDYVVATDNDNSLTAFTIEAWVKWTPSAATDVQFICGKGVAQMELHTGGGAGANGLRFIPTTQVYLDAANVLPTGVWTHVAVVYNPSESLAKMYINGVEVSLTNGGVNPLSTAIANTATPFYIGSRSDASYRFNGSMDEVRVWNQVRSQSEIQADMDNAISAASSGLINYYNFNEGTTGSMMLPDLTSNGHNGTLTNFALTGSTSNWVESYAMIVPTATAATSITNAGFTANWTSPATGTVNDYKLYVATDAAFSSLVAGYNPLTVASSSTTSAITGLSANTTYYYRVQADKSTVTGEGAWSNAITAQTLPLAPTVTSQAVSSISTTTATGNGNITLLGNPTPTQYGVVWGTSENPTVDLSTKTTQGTPSGTGAFTSSITGLSVGTTYHVRAYATNTAGTSYGDDVTFTTLTAGTYIGAGTDWNTAANWAGNSVPTSGTDVTIPSGKTVIIGSTTAANCTNLTVTGTLTIESSIVSTGSLIIRGTVSGNATVRRYMISDAWHTIGSPLSGQTVGEFLTANTTLATKPGDPTNKAMKDYNETSNNWNGLNYYTTSTGDMEANKGYAVWPATNGVVSFEGALQSGNKEVSVVRTNYGWNCIGNPYTSAIAINSPTQSLNNFIDINLSGTSKFANSYEAIYVWNQATSSYDIVNHTYQDNRAYYIPVGQAFFVRAAANGSFNFTPAMQSHQPGAPFKSVEVEWPTISINATANSKSSKAVVKFNPDMSRGLDVGYDAGAMKTGFDIYTRLVDDNGVDFGIQCLPLNESYTIPVGIEITEGGSVNLQLAASNLPSNCTVAFEDRERGTSVPISKSTQSFVVDVPANSNFAKRFYLQVSSANSTTGMGNWGNKLVVTSGKGQINISGIESSNGMATLYDVQGRKLSTIKLNSRNANTISTSGLRDGIYLLRVNQAGGTITRKVTVKN